MRITKVAVQRATHGLAACIGLAAIALLAPAASLAAPPAYSLLGTWKSGYLAANGSRLPANGTQTVTTMNMQTGVFSGHSVVEGTSFALSGVENGTSLEFVQSEGGYAAHDKVPKLSILPNGHVGGNGSFEAGKFWIEVQSKASSTPGAGPEEETPEGKPAAFVSVLCNIFPSAPSTSTCTADVGDLSSENRKTPTGTVTFTSTAGTFLGDTCSLSLVIGLGNVAACTVSFQPAPGTQQGAPLPVIAHYSGDTSFAAAAGGSSPVSASPGVSGTPVNNGGFFEVPMVNPNYSAVTGTVTVSLAGAAGSARARAAGALAGSSFKLTRFGSKTLRLKLSPTGLLKLRAKHRLRVTVTVSTRVSGKRVSHSYKLTLRLKKR
jgi:hypothetical protein